MTKRLSLWFLFLTAAAFATAEQKTLLFFGDSLTAGYGLDDPATESFPGLIQARIDAAGLPYRVVNAGLSGETTAGGLRRVDWILRQPVHIFVLGLGGNDGLRGVPVSASKANLRGIIEKVRARNPNAIIVLAGMQMPRSLGPDYTRDFAGMYPEIADSMSATLIPFLLEGVGGVASLNLPDGIHPNAEGHRKVADVVWSVLRPLL
jgi:acyl-CoA thioesterase-1